MAARKTKSIQSLGEKALAEAKGGAPKSRKKAAKKSSGGAKKSRKKSSVSKETGKLREAVRVVNEARRLLSEAGCATSANAGRASKKR
jgi:hypothetical protein